MCIIAEDCGGLSTAVPSRQVATGRPLHRAPKSGPSSDRTRSGLGSEVRTVSNGGIDARVAAKAYLCWYPSVETTN